jgi:hypothetical protein
MTPPLSLKRFGLTALVMLLIVGPFILQGAGAAPQLVTWGPTQVRSTTDGLTDTYSAIDYDSAGKIHVAWYEYGTTSGSTRLLYTNNVSGSWIAPYEVSAGVATGAEPLLDMKIETNHVHFLYILATTSQVAHRYLTLTGSSITRSGAVSISGTQKGANPELVIDRDGKVNAFYITRATDTDPYQVYHKVWVGGSWGGLARIPRPDNIIQKFPNVVATNDGKLHLAFLSNGDTFRYYIFDGNSWAESTVIYSGKAKQIHLATNGTTVFALYSAQPGNFHNIYFRQGGYGSWTNEMLLSSGTTYDENPFGYYNQARNTFFAFWMSGGSTADTRLVVREYSLGGAWSNVVDLGGVKVQYPRAAGSAESVSVVWQDKVSGTYDIRMRTTVTGSTPTPTSVIPPTVPPTIQPTVTPSATLVDFDFTRTSASPTNNANVGVSVTPKLGNPNQMRYSLTPFAANSSLPAWQALQTAFTVNTSTAIVNCGVAIYAQVRDSTTGSASPVRAVTAAVDTTIQSTATLYTMESQPSANRPADVLSEQPFAPNGGDPNYTRSFAFNYHFAQEPATCSGLKSYQVETYTMSPAPMPSVVDGFAPFNPFNSAADTNGVGLPEQTIIANLTLTDTLGNKTAFTKTIYYDDDPPVLSPGGSITFPSGTSTNLSLTSISFTAVVTDDGYTNSAPATKKYWGAWIVATKSATLPGPEVFAQYGKVHALDAGGTTLAGVNLTNDYNQELPVPAMRTAGARYVHMRFLDGAGNYSEAGITSPAITLNGPFVDGALRFMPRVSK